MDDLKTIVAGTGRVFLYSLLTASIFVLIFLSVRSEVSAGGVFRENSLLEGLQLLLLAITFVTIATCTTRGSPLRQSAILIAAFILAAIVRENDSRLDLIHKEAWEVLVIACLAPAFLNAWRNRATLAAELRLFSPSLAFGVFLSGFVTTFVFSRLFGMNLFWKEVMRDEFNGVVKNISEEGTELYGYGLLLIAAVEFVILARRLRRAERPVRGSVSTEA